jgi:hypothetical protein
MINKIQKVYRDNPVNPANLVNPVYFLQLHPRLSAFICGGTRSQKSEVRSQKAEGRRQKAEGRSGTVFV